MVGNEKRLTEIRQPFNFLRVIPEDRADQQVYPNYALLAESSLLRRRRQATIEPADIKLKIAMELGSGIAVTPTSET